ncbi:MAG TPA: translation initiation factor 2 [Pseudomonas sp.]|jgi:septal ring factor EnvC (AmiA/AmiB activator)|nr:translation initiation factor 2 [Pseudomonas sp.]
MRHYVLTLLLVAGTVAHAEETQLPAVAAAPVANDAQIEALQRQLADSEQKRSELLTQLEGSMVERENAQMARLRQDNQKLKLQVREAQSRQPKSPLNEKQTWFLIGATASLLGVLIGALLRGSRKSRRQWIN